MIGSKAAAPSSPSSAFRMMPPATSSLPIFNSKRKTPSAICARCTPWSRLTACRSACTAIVTASSSATMPTGPWPNNSPANSAHPFGSGSGRTRHPANPRLLSPSQRSHRARLAHLPGPPGQRTPPRPHLRSRSANQVLARFCADYNQRFAVPAREAQSDFRSLPPRFDLARCLSFRYQRVVGPDHVITFGAHSIALPALPSKRGYAGDTVALSHHLDGLLLISYRKVLLLSLLSPLPLLEHADRRPAPRTSRQKS